MGKLVKIVVLNDDSTFSGIEGCKIVEVNIPEDNTQDETDFINDAIAEGTVHSSQDVDARFVLVVGNPFDGMTIQGPFSTAEDATIAGEGFSLHGVDWWVKEIEAP